MIRRFKICNMLFCRESLIFYVAWHFQGKNKHLFIRMICSFHRLNLFVPSVEKPCAIKYADLMEMDFTYHNAVEYYSQRG